MVVPHSAFTDTAKGQVMLSDVEQTVVDTDAARHDALQQGLDGLTVIAEGVDGQRPCAAVDGAYRLL